MNKARKNSRQKTALITVSSYRDYFLGEYKREKCIQNFIGNLHDRR
jgi:hypothetical protein